MIEVTSIAVCFSLLVYSLRCSHNFCSQRGIKDTVIMTQLRDQNVPEHHVVGLSLTLEREWDKLRWRWQGLVPGIHFRVGSLDLLGHHKEHHVHRIVFISDEICAVGEPLPLQILVAFKPARRISFIRKLCFTLAELASDIGPSV